MIGQPIVPLRQGLQRQRREHDVIGKSELPGLFRDRNHDCFPRHCRPAGVRSSRYHAAPKAVSPRSRNRRALVPWTLEFIDARRLMGIALPFG